MKVYERIFSGTTRANVLTALEYAVELEKRGESIADLPGSGPSHKYFIESEGDLFHAKATLRYAMQVAGINTAETEHRFDALQAVDYLKRLGFEIVEWENATPTVISALNRRRRLANVLERPGQAAFRRAVLSRCNFRCIISGCSAIDAIDAAHIQAVADGGSDKPTNGIVLRADLHRLFDSGLLKINWSTHRVQVDKSIRSDYGGFENTLIPKL